MLREVLIKDDENILVHGRTVPGRDPAVLLWGGSGIELNVNGTELWVDIQACYSNREPWIAIEIDGALIARQIVDTERRWIPIYRQKEAGRPTRVRIIKEQQAMGEDTDHRLEVWGFKTDGEILPAKQYTKKIEFIGDSINSGEVESLIFLPYPCLSLHGGRGSGRGVPRHKPGGLGALCTLE